MEKFVSVGMKQKVDTHMEEGGLTQQRWLMRRPT